MSRWSLAVVCVVFSGLGALFVADRTLNGQNPTPPVTVTPPKELTSYRDIVKKVMPAVVSIEGRVKPKVKPADLPRNRRGLPPDNPQSPEEFRKFFEDFGQNNPYREFGGEEAPTTGFGSGFIIDSKGIVLTNFHVVNGADSVEVRLADGRKFVSSDIKGDRKTDLAIVKLDAKDLPWLELGDSDAMEIGDRVLAVGAPFGLTGTVTHGIISAKGRNGLHMNMYEDFLQTDAPINPGNSGGPLISLDGKVIGINAAIKSRSGGFQGVGLAVSSNLARNVIKQLEATGVVKRGYLGVQIKELAPEVAAKLGVTSGKGVVVGQVFDASPAAKAGLQAGDVITSLNGKAIKDGHELQVMVATLTLSKPVEVQVMRDGKPKTLHVTVEQQPEEFGEARVPVTPGPRRGDNSITMDKLGLSVTDMTQEMAEQMGFKSLVEGAAVSQVERGSPAFEAGIQRGMVITKVGKEAVKSASALQEAVNKVPLEKGVLFQVQSPRGGTDYVVVKVTENAK